MDEVKEIIHPQVVRIQEQPRIEQRSPEWLHRRGTLLTASDCAAALGIPPFHSFKGDPRAELIQRKAEQALGITGFQGNEATEHGQKYEPVALDLYATQYGQRVLDFGLLIHPDYPWLGGSPDGITEAGYLIEVKWYAPPHTPMPP